MLDFVDGEAGLFVAGEDEHHPRELLEVFVEPVSVLELGAGGEDDYSAAAWLNAVEVLGFTDGKLGSTGRMPGFVSQDALDLPHIPVVARWRFVGVG